jgi:ankyrin repeat protein
MECMFIYIFFEWNIFLNNSLRFLLARLHLDSLEDKISVMQVEDAMEKLPKGEYAYREAYDEAMEKRVKGQKPTFADLALRTLSWITFSKRPLTTSELQHALAVTDGASVLNLRNLTPIDLITSVCAGLVTVDEGSNIIRLVHYTTQEYFDRTWATWFPNGQTDIAKTCVTYLSFSAFETGISYTVEDLEARLQLNILYDYASRNWGHHARGSLIEGGKLISDFLESAFKVFASSEAMIYQIYGYRGRWMRGIQLAAYFGLRESVSTLLDKNANVESKDMEHRTPLSWAAENGHEAVVKLLLDKNADVESKDVRYGQTPLSWAAEKGHKGVVKLLLDKNSDVESKDDSYGQTPLSWAARKGHEAVVELLLDKKADVKSKDKDDRTPLSWAAENGHEAVVKLLLDKDADIESKDKNDRTPLSWAAENSHEAVVKLLLDKDADIESKDKNDRTPLSWAAEKAHEAVMKLLLDKNADVQSKDDDDRTPLR